MLWKYWKMFKKLQKCTKLGKSIEHCTKLFKAKWKWAKLQALKKVCQNMIVYTKSWESVPELESVPKHDKLC